MNLPHFAPMYRYLALLPLQFAVDCLDAVHRSHPSKGTLRMASTMTIQMHITHLKAALHETRKVMVRESQ